jgi:hypothetical protein
MSKHGSQITISRLGLTNQFSFFDESGNDLFSPAQDQETNAHDDRTTDHDWSSSTPFAGAFIGHNAYNRLHDQS